MAETSAEYQLFVGIDIAADTFTVAWLVAGGEPTVPYTGDQTPPGYGALQRRLQATAVPPAATLVVLEATGNYWVTLAVALHEAGYPVAVVNPLQAHLSWPFTPSDVIFWTSWRRRARIWPQTEQTARTGDFPRSRARCPDRARCRRASRLSLPPLVPATFAIQRSSCHSSDVQAARR